MIQLTTTGGAPDDRWGDTNRVELPCRLVPLRAPAGWYNNAVADKYYTTFRSTSMDSGNSSFLEAYDFAWYRTVRIIYSEYHSPASINREFTIFNNRAGTTLKGTAKGRGILEGIRAALTAFDALY